MALKYLVIDKIIYLSFKVFYDVSSCLLCNILQYDCQVKKDALSGEKRICPTDKKGYDVCQAKRDTMFVRQKGI